MIDFFKELPTKESSQSVYNQTLHLLNKLNLNAKNMISYDPYNAPVSLIMKK